MMLTSFLRVLTSGVLFFLLLATTTITLVRPADGASSSWGDLISEACGDGNTACGADETCVGCLHPRVTESEEFDACGVAYGFDDSEESAATCAAYAAYFCCIDQVSEHECLENDAFEELTVCWMAGLGCSEDNLTCASGGATSGGIFNPLVVGFSCAIVILLPFFWSGS